MPNNTSSMNRGKDWLALHSPKGIQSNLYSPKGFDDCGLLDVPVGDWYLVVALPQVELAEHLLALKTS